jgi:hypothetical protein
MKFFSTLATLAIATGALATPVFQRSTEKGVLATRTSATASEFTATPIIFCLSSSQATKIVNAFNYLLANPTAANFNTTANALFASTWTDTSDSINQLISPSGTLVRHTLSRSIQYANSLLFIPYMTSTNTLPFVGRNSYLREYNSIHHQLHRTACAHSHDPGYLQQLHQDRLALDLRQWCHWPRRLRAGQGYRCLQHQQQRPGRGHLC